MVWREISRAVAGGQVPGGAPSASFNFSISSLTVTFTDTSTDPPPGSIVAWLWTFGDGTTSTVQNPVKTYASSGTKAVSLRVTDDNGNQSTDSRQVILGGAITTRTAYGSWGLAQSLWGFDSTGQPVCPTPDNMQNNTSASTLMSWIDAARSKGSCFIFSPIGGNPVTKNPDGSFSEAKWMARWDTWWASISAISGGVTKLRNAVRDKVCRGMNGLDDFVEGVGDRSVVGSPDYLNAYRFALTFSQIDNVFKHAKLDAPWFPMFARGPAHSLKSAWTNKGGGAKYLGLDGAWNQCRPRLDGNYATYWANEAAIAASVDLSMVGGMNITQGSGNDPAWGCIETSTGHCGVSPNEIKNWGDAAMAVPAVYGYYYWSYNQRLVYWSKPEIQAAFRHVYDTSVGRAEGPANVRGDLVPA